MNHRRAVPTLFSSLAAALALAACSAEAPSPVPAPSAPAPPPAAQPAPAPGTVSATATATVTVAGAGPKVGETAPDFELKDHDGAPFRLSSLRGKKWVVVAFYPRAASPG